MQPKRVRPDNKGRITLGHFADGISSFSMIKEKNGRIILEPFLEIPAQEKWLFDNKEALRKVKQGLKDATEGRVKELGSFAKFAEDDVE